MPGWHEKTEALQEDGKLRLVGIIEEQHPDRTRLFMQWKEMSWPLLHDPINLLAVEAVPLTYLIDEHGVVRYEKPSDDDLRTFLATDYSPVTPVTIAPKNLVPAAGSAEHLLLWKDDVDRAILLLEKRVREQPDDASAHFRLGVARRRRYDSDSPGPNDFQKAVEHWVKALDLDPNQYIFRRRIQQYGPRLDKPYPFYDWVPEARQAILSRGETPVELRVEPGGAEYATRLEELVEDVSGNGVEPDPRGRIYRDEKPLIRTETVVVPNVVASGEAARVHVVMRPDENLEAHWNNEVSDLVFWVSPPEGWRVDSRMHRVAVPPDPVSQELRRIEFEILTPPGFSGSTTIPAYALYYVCEDVDGTCLYRRQDIEARIEVR